MRHTWLTRPTVAGPGASGSPSDGQAARRTGRLLGLTVAMVPIGFCLVAGLMLYDLRQDTRAQAVNNETNLLRAVSRDIARNVELYDLSLQAVVDNLAVPGLDRLDPSLQDLLLYDRAASAKDLGAILVVNRDGRVVRGSDHAAVGAELGDREWFKAQRDRPDRGLFISAPFKRRVTGDDEVIALSRSVRSGDGTFLGVVVGTMRLTYFRDLFGQADLGAQGIVNLVRTDGTSLVRVPYEAARSGINVAGSGVFAKILSAPAGSFSARSGIDGIDRVYGFAHVGDLPLVLAVGLAEDEVFATWRAKAATIVLALVALCALAGALWLRLAWQSRRTAQAERMLSRSETQFRLLADHAEDVIMRLDGAMRRTYVSPAAEVVMGFQPEEFLRREPEEVVHPDDWPTVEARVAAAREERAGVEATYRVRHKAGHYIWAEARYSFVATDGGFVVVLRDVSARKAAETGLEAANAELARVARTDALTGLPNRRHFDEALADEWQRAAHASAPASLLLIDVDLFKSYNDLYGHPAGDACLRSVAQAVQAAVRRPRDLAARYGGEEMAAILPDTDEEGAAFVAERVRAAVEALALTHGGNPNRGRVTVSVGCATAKPEIGDDVARFLAAADERLYEAKGAGRNMVSSGPPASRSAVGPAAEPRLPELASARHPRQAAAA